LFRERLLRDKTNSISGGRNSVQTSLVTRPTDIDATKKELRSQQKCGSKTDVQFSCVLKDRQGISAELVYSNSRLFDLALLQNLVMSQRITLDLQSFEQVLAAASLLQQIQEGALRHGDGEGCQPLLELLEIQQAVHRGNHDFRVVAQRIVGLVQQVVGARGAGVWFFTGQELAYFAGVGSVADGDRLRFQILSKLAAYQPGDSSSPTLSHLQRQIRDVGYYPASVKSLLVTPIYHGSALVGTLAALSPEFDAFTERDTENARLLSGLLAQAVEKAVEAGLWGKPEAERAATVQLIEKTATWGREPSANQEQIGHSSPNVFAQISEPELPPSASSSEIPILNERPPKILAPTDIGGGSEVKRGPGAAEPLGAPSANGIAAAIAFVHPLTRPSESWVSRLRASSRALVRHVSRHQPKLRAAGKWMKDFALRPVRFPVLYFSWRLFGRVSPYQPRPRVISERKKESTSWSAQPGLRRTVTNARNRWLEYYRLGKWEALYVAGAWALVLVTLVTFVATEIWMPEPPQSEARDSTVTSRAISTGTGNVGRSLDSTPAPSKVVGKPRARESDRGVATRPRQLSHLEVTDSETDMELRDMTGYEISKLGKEAQDGDDVAAFDLGMAYEIGYEVPQDCVEAANWVTRSAQQGNPAAEYNLGLRYRDGDGVTASAEDAVRWLRQAAAQKHLGARLALKALVAPN
jgi:Sel1 repeat-containing protein/GAF domain-containing protein